jgi:hypothetical protein
MERRILISVVVAMLFASLVASPAAEASSGSGSASVTSRVAVNAKVDYTVVDPDHIDLRSNTPWRLTLVGIDGATEVRGPATGNDAVRLDIPEGTTDYFVTITH